MRQTVGSILGCLFLFLSFSPVLFAQESSETDATTGATTKAKPRFELGGYGEISMQRMFYSDNVARYTYPETHKSGKHGRFDIPHLVVFMGYDFGKGWKFSSEIEFEHGGTGTTIEIENAESGEYEAEIEKGGEVAIEQFWIEKTFNRALNVRLGHIIVPIGLTNMHHMPTEFFSVLRPEEESTLIPCTWHETGISLWGNKGAWRYEVQFLAGLDAERFNNAGWIHGGSVSPYEFKIATNYAGALRIDNYSMKGLRVGLSGYYGHSALNTLKSSRYEGLDGAVTVGAFDAVYDDHHLVLKSNVLYGHLSDSYQISMLNKKMQSASPSPRTDVASDVLSWYVEAGYNLLSLFPQMKEQEDRLYLWAHYGFYDSMYKTATGIPVKGWCEKRTIKAGLTYFPLKEVVIKAEYSLRKFEAPYNDEPTLSLGVAYSGMFFSK